MANYNSIAFGRSRGKIGNVVLSCGKFGTIAKQKPSKGARVSTPQQVKKQDKLQNTYKSYSMITLALKGLKSYRKPKQNIWNCWVQNFNQYFSESTVLTPYQACNELAGVDFGYSKFINPRSMLKYLNKVRVYFEFEPSVQPTNIYCLICVWDENSQGSVFHERKITAYDRGAKMVEFEFNYINATHAFSYFYRKKNDMCSKIIFRKL